VAQVQEAQSVAWTSDGKLLLSDGQAVRRMNPDGSQQSTLLNDPNSWIMDMASCGERYFLLAWAFHGGTNNSSIWRVNADGTNPKQLTNEAFARTPLCSPDGKWAYYSGPQGHFAMRVPLDGGTAEPVPGSDVKGMYAMSAEAISPDGKQLVFQAEVNVPEGLRPASVKLAVVNLDSSTQTSPRLLEPDPRIASSGGTGFANSLAFTPNGKSVAYIIRDQGVDNIFVQALDGAPGHAITNFTSEHIAQFQWSPDGKTLAVARAHDTSDVVLLREK
jgi:sugar lactone lactonase YvrE